MDLATFKSSTEWLRAPQVSPDISTARESLGVMLGGAGWYEADAQLAELLAFLNQPGQHALVAWLEQAAGETAGDGDRAAWTLAVLAAFRYGEPARDESSGMAYRYDKLHGAYEWEDPQNPGTWLSHEEAGRLAAERAQSDADSAAPPAQYSEAQYPETQHSEAQYSEAQHSEAQHSEAQHSEAQWDQGWGMFYRLAPDGSYLFAHAVRPGVPESGPGDQWLTHDQVAAGAGAPAPAAEPPAATEPPGEQEHPGLAAAAPEDGEPSGEELERALRELFGIPPDKPVVIVQ